MKIHELEHIIRAAGEIASVKELIIMGSQSVLAQYPNLDDERITSDKSEIDIREHSRATISRSIETDIWINEKGKGDKVEGAIGELSDFHDTNGYYMQAVDDTTCIFPEGWRDRLIRICNENTNNIVGWCVEIHDLTISKLYANREKDIEFFEAAVELNLIEKEILIRRLKLTDIDTNQKDIISHKIEEVF